ncbi:MAG: hypothetical protein H5U37_05605 [Caldisericia bacterium]|nr:hypothetical protein [Caldisericia bacterium]
MEIKLFKPKFYSSPYIFLGSLVAFLLLLIIIIPILMIKIESKIDFPIIIILSILFMFIIIHNLNLILIYKTMRYEFRDDGLHLICGKYHEKIDYKNILGYEKRNLKINLMASHRFPGFALVDVLYSDIGIVRMFSTSSTKNILIIKTKDRLYGITPFDEEEFIQELEKRIKEEK